MTGRQRSEMVVSIIRGTPPSILEDSIRDVFTQLTDDEEIEEIKTYSSEFFRIIRSPAWSFLFIRFRGEVFKIGETKCKYADAASMIDIDGVLYKLNEVRESSGFHFASDDDAMDISTTVNEYVTMFVMSS